MKRILSATLAIFLSLAIMITFTPIMGGEAYAASKLKAPNVTVTDVTDHAVTLSWGKISKAKSYKVYKKVGKKFKAVKTVKGTSATISNLNENKAYQFKVRAAKKANGKKLGKYSKIAKAKTWTSKKYTKSTVRRVGEGSNLFEVDYTFDYQRENILDGDFQAEIVDALNNGESSQTLIGDELGLDISAEILSEDKGSLQHCGCTAFATDNDEGHQIMGRNYDWTLEEPGLITHTNPENGYASVGIASMGFAGMEDADFTADEISDKIFMAPFYTVDGVNEAGLACAVLIIDENGTYQTTTKAPMMTSYAIREMLDTCATVEEAVQMFKSRNWVSSMATAGYQDVYGDAMGEDFHWCVTDATGNQAIIEFLNGKLKVNYDYSVLNLNDAEYNVDGYNDFYYSYLYNDCYKDWWGWGFDPGVVAKDAKTSRGTEDFVCVTNFYVSRDGNGEGCKQYTGEGVTRYEKVFNYLKSNNNPSNDEAMALLEEVSYNKSGHTDSTDPYYVFDEDILDTYYDVYDKCDEAKAKHENSENTGMARIYEYASDPLLPGFLYESDPENCMIFWGAFEDPDTAELFDSTTYDSVLSGVLSVGRDNYATGTGEGAADWGWETCWSCVYDVTDSTFDICPHQDYENVYSFGIDY